MLMMVKSGRRKISTKALYKLDQAERAAGIVIPASPIETASDNSSDGAKREAELRAAVGRAIKALEDVKRLLGE